MTNSERRSPRPASAYTLLAVYSVLLVVLLVLTVMSTRATPTSEMFRLIFSEWWSITFAAEYFCALFVIATWVGVIEKDKRVAAAWIVGLAVLGVWVALIYAIQRVWRAERLRDVFRPKTSNTEGGS